MNVGDEYRLDWPAEVRGVLDAEFGVSDAVKVPLPGIQVRVDTVFLHAATRFVQQPGVGMQVDEAIGDVFSSTIAAFGELEVPRPVPAFVIMRAVEGLTPLLVRNGLHGKAVTGYETPWKGLQWQIPTYDVKSVEEWDIEALTHEIVHALMRHTPLEDYVLSCSEEKRELFVESVSHCACMKARLRSRYWGLGEHLAYAQRQCPSFDAEGFIKAMLAEARAWGNKD